MATLTYKCSICNRTIDLVENRQGLTTFGKCVITQGCRGKLNKIKYNIDNVREVFPPEINGLQDYTQRKALANYTQSLASSTWMINHNLDTNPTISVFIKNASGILESASPDMYDVTFINSNTLSLSFKASYTGSVQLLARNSVKSKPKTATSEVPPFQATSNGTFIFAVPKYLTKFAYPPSLLPSPTTPYDLDSAPIRVEVSIQRPNMEEEICTEYLDSSLFGTPWSDFNEVLIRKRRNYYIFSKNVLNFRTFGGDGVTYKDIPEGTQLKITRIDYGTGVLQPIPSEGAFVLLSQAPYTTNDKIRDKVIDLSNMMENTDGSFSFSGTDFFVNVNQVEKTYPEISKVLPKPPRPSPSPTPSPSPSVPLF